MSRIKQAIAAASAVLALTGSTLVAAAPAEASTLNLMRCEPDTGWCYQSNPPYKSGYPHYCQWDHTLYDLHSGMWYTGCDIWGSDIY